MNEIKDKYKYMSNAEIKVRLIEMENEYTAIQSKIKSFIEKMNDLDREYTQAKTIYNKRTGGLNL